MAITTLRRFQKAGHRPIALIGGATGMIGDPSGKSEERNLLEPERLWANVAGVERQLRQFLDHDCGRSSVIIVNNYDWMANYDYLGFLRDVGKHFPVNVMLTKDSVRSRLETGLSYTEFSYMLLQAYDFVHLHDRYGCLLQIGGSDQWGNITAGMDLTRKKLGRTVFGLTLPLITNANGTKFGKTEAGSVWLDPSRTSIYKFYQFWIRTDDRDAVRYLKFFTFLSQEEIAALEKQHIENPGARAAHKALAKEVTDLVHGPAATAEAMRASEILFGGELAGISETTFNEIVGEVPTKEIGKADLDGTGKPLVELLVHSGLCTAKGQARRDIEGGGAYVNNIREPSFQRTVTAKDLLFGKHLLLRKGKRNYVVLTAK